MLEFIITYLLGGNSVYPNYPIRPVPDKTRIIDYGTDEFAPKPLSMENVADKAFMLIARDALKGDN